VIPRQTFSTDEILDAAGDIVVRNGPRALTIDAVTRATAAPVGSIYHRFRSVDELLARLWLRAARRSQDAGLEADAALGERARDDPVEAAVTVALALYDVCVRERTDAILLASFRPADVLRLRLPAELATELSTINEPIKPLIDRTARACFGRANARTRDLVHLVLADLPYGFARRHLEAGLTPPPSRRTTLGLAVRAVLSSAAATRD
jgi:AcrR family transcriptional regulator